MWLSTASMDDYETKNLLKERSKLTEYFYGCGQRESNCDKVLEKSA